jgi:hypothetical protein
MENKDKKELQKEHFNKLAKVVRYAGLNIPPQSLDLILNEKLIFIVNKFNSFLKENPNVSLEELDVFIQNIVKNNVSKEE